MPRTLIGVLLSIGAGACLSSGGIALRLIESAGPFQILFFRALTFLVLMTFVLVLMYRSRCLQAIYNVGKPGLIVALMLGIGAIFYVLAILNTTVANAVVILSTSPLLTALLTWLVLKKATSPATLAASVVALAGVALMVVDGLDAGGLLGMVIAFGAASSYAVILVLLQQQSHRDMLPATALSGFVTLAVAWSLVPDLDLSNHDIGISMFLGAFQFGLGFVLITLATRFIDATLVALLTLSEVVLAPLWVWIGIGEIPAPLALAGGVVVLGAVTAQALRAWLTKAN